MSNIASDRILECKQLLKDTSLFCELSDSQLEQVVTLLEESRVAPGELIIREGQPGSRLHVVKEGRVRVEKILGDDPVRLADLYAGAMLGEMTLIEPAPTSASVVAVDPTILLSVSREDFISLLDRDSAMAAKLYQGLCRILVEKMRKNNERIKEYFLINRALIDNEEFRRLYTSYHKPAGGVGADADA
ncbi:MAG: cyclic nucleotide-binding domain-containing protein [Candidatus Schekmanbacteria bacterium]|nr:cyclic nucleotide-binding domain-containing protein [Candidatus Schekmanbacteria bacterium]